MEIYVELLDEGVSVWCPVEALPEGNGFRLPDHATEGEVWRFPPGSLVRGEQRELSEGEVLVATEIIR